MERMTPRFRLLKGPLAAGVDSKTLTVQFERYTHRNDMSALETKTISPVMLRELLGNTYERDTFVICGDDGKYYDFVADFRKVHGCWVCDIEIIKEV